MARIESILSFNKNLPTSMRSEPIAIRPMTLEDVKSGMRLSSVEGWNQTEKDWRFLIEYPGNICLLAEMDKKVVGTTTAINYVNNEAWIGMVLVDKDFRGLGISTSLLTHVFTKLSFCKAIKLDATLAGQLVYQKFGFIEEYRIARMVCTTLNHLPIVEDAITAEPIQLKHIEDIIFFDEVVFGVNRRQLIEFLLKEYPKKGWLLKRDNQITGFILGRDGSRYHQIGPLVATNTLDAKILISIAISCCNRQPIVVDVLEDKEDFINWLNEIGFSKQRHFIRMYKEENPFPGKTDKHYLIAGPEFG